MYIFTENSLMTVLSWGFHLILGLLDVTQLIGSTAGMNPSTQCARKFFICARERFQGSSEHFLESGVCFLGAMKRFLNAFCFYNWEPKIISFVPGKVFQVPRACLGFILNPHRF